MLRIKELRKNRGLTAKKLAEEIKVAGSTISLYENGKRQPDYETLAKIADYLNVSVDYLNVSVDYLLGRSEKEKSTEDKPLKLTKLQEAYEQADESIKLAVDKLLDL